MLCRISSLYILVVPYSPSPRRGFVEGFLLGIQDFRTNTQFPPPRSEILRVLGQRLYNVAYGRGDIRIILPEEMKGYVSESLLTHCELIKIGNFRNQLARYLGCAGRAGLRACCNEPDVLFLGVQDAFHKTCVIGDAYGWKIHKKDSIRITVEPEEEKSLEIAF